jgi:hypothetical protein
LAPLFPNIQISQNKAQYWYFIAEMGSAVKKRARDKLVLTIFGLFFPVQAALLFMVLVAGIDESSQNGILHL